MCTYLKDATIHIAEEDIKCYKVVNLTCEYKDGNKIEGVNYKSAYLKYYYEKGKRYHVELPTSLEELSIYYTEIVRTKYIKHGFHSFEKLEDAKMENQYLKHTKIVECIIPKGSHYYKGFEEYSQLNMENPWDFSTPSYVSEDIILNDILPWSFPFNYGDDCILEYVDINGQHEKIKGQIKHIFVKANHQMEAFFYISRKKRRVLVLSLEGEVLGLRSPSSSDIVKEYKIMPTLTKIEEK